MPRADETLGPRRLHKLAPLAGDAKVTTQERLRGDGSQTHDGLRPHNLDFRLKPGTAGGNLARLGPGVQAPFPSRLPFEVLDGVRQIDLAPVDAGRREGFV